MLSAALLVLYHEMRLFVFHPPVLAWKAETPFRSALASMRYGSLDVGLGAALVVVVVLLVVVEVGSSWVDSAVGAGSALVDVEDAVS